MFPLQVPADSREYHDINRERSALYGSISVLQKNANASICLINKVPGPSVPPHPLLSAAGHCTVSLTPQCKELRP